MSDLKESRWSSSSSIGGIGCCSQPGIAAVSECLAGINQPEEAGDEVLVVSYWGLSRMKIHRRKDARDMFEVSTTTTITSILLLRCLPLSSHAIRWRLLSASCCQSMNVNVPWFNRFTTRSSHFIPPHNQDPPPRCITP